MMKTLCDVTDYDDSDLPLLGVKADIDGSFENDFLRGHAVNKYNKLVPWVGCWRAAAAPLADRWPLPAVGCCERASRRQRLDQGQHGERRGK